MPASEKLTPDVNGRWYGCHVQSSTRLAETGAAVAVVAVFPLPAATVLASAELESALELGLGALLDSELGAAALVIGADVVLEPPDAVVLPQPAATRQAVARTAVRAMRGQDTAVFDNGHMKIIRSEGAAPGGRRSGGGW